MVAYRFVARDTVEEKVIALQERKRALFDMTVEQGRFPVEQLTREDIEEFFAGDEASDQSPLEKPDIAPSDTEDPTRNLLSQDEPLTSESVSLVTGWPADKSNDWLRSQVDAGVLVEHDHAATPYFVKID